MGVITDSAMGAICFHEFTPPRATTDEEKSIFGWEYEEGKYLRVDDGLQYAGYCVDYDCPSHGGMVTCHVGKGSFQFHDEYLKRNIRCPACNKPFFPFAIVFSNCSARIKKCYKGEKPEVKEISASYGVHSLYWDSNRTFNFLEFDVKDKGVYGQPFSFLLSDEL